MKDNVVPLPSEPDTAEMEAVDINETVGLNMDIRMSELRMLRSAFADIIDAAAKMGMEQGRSRERSGGRAKAVTAYALAKMDLETQLWHFITRCTSLQHEIEKAEANGYRDAELVHKAKTPLDPYAEVGWRPPSRR